jgi:hypothetical protein
VGLVKQWQMEQLELDRRQAAREWLQDELGRAPTEDEIDARWDDFELAEAFTQALDKND